jgi:toxin FitB
VVEWLRTRRPEEIYISAVTFGELQIGVELTRRQNQAKADELGIWIDELADSAQVVPMDIDCFREWARLMTGKSYDLSEDAMIAAAARVHSLTVVTRNERDFCHFKVPVLNPFTTK